MKTGIYTITNKVNNKIYLGCTTDFIKRKSEHLIKLRNGIHKNKHLQLSFNKYKEENFIFEILLECQKEHLASEEHFWATLLKVNNREFGYNQRPTHPYGKIINTPEMSANLSRKLTGRKLSKESIQKRTETRAKNAVVKGFYHSAETKKKIRDKHIGMKQTPESIEKMKLKLKGRKLSKEHIQKAIDGRKGYKHSQETKNKIGNANRKIRF